MNRLRERVKDDAAMTVIETVVAMSLAGVLLAVVGSVYLSSLSAMSDQRARTSLTAEARVVMESVARRARVAIRPAGEAAALVTATPTSLTLYSSVMVDGVETDPAPIKAEYYVDKGCLMEARTPARKLASALPSGQLYAWDTGRRVVCLAHLRGAPVFSYYDSAAITAGGTTVKPLTVPAGGLPATVRPNVRSIALSLTVADPDRETAGGIPLSTRVTLTNLATDAVGG